MRQKDTRRQLTQEKRCQVFTLLESGKTIRGIAKFIGVSSSTISRELKRNSRKQSYGYKRADELASRRLRMAIQQRRDAASD